ncbi:oligopeptide transporter, OPT family [candidate division KSB1 bacterium]|nr:oligopeptide transporter, OPT family [candidate division KSB1 bacterium]
MSEKASEKPYIPAESNLPEFTFKALFLGLVMAVVLGAANAYLGLRAGQTVSASFPAAVIAIAAFRIMRGNVLEQNIARTAASVGEALVAGAIFTIPAFVIANVGGERVWTDFNYWETSFILLIGGVLGVMFIVILRRTLTVDAGLPFPESRACTEIVKAGQHGETGAKYVFGTLGFGMLLQIFKADNGLKLFRESISGIITLPQSIIHHFSGNRTPMGDVTHSGVVPWATFAISPALIGVGYVIGPQLATINFVGGMLAWLVLIPLILFINPELSTQLTLDGQAAPLSDVINSVWYNHVRPIAVGAMLVAAVKTLWGLRDSLAAAFKGALKKGSAVAQPSRLEQDLDLRMILGVTILLAIPMAVLYYYFSQSVVGAVVSAIVMLLLGFLLSAVGGYLVGLVGGSNQPISGLTLSTLIIAALLMVFFGVKGIHGVGAVLGVAAVVCCACAISGDMIQDLKIGQLLGGTPRRMEIAEIISVVVVSFVLVFPIIALHKSNILGGGIGIGDKALPAPQAGLMAQLAVGIVGGEMPWGLILFGAFLALALIMIKAPAPMLIAVGMYLPFETTFAIFIGGVIKWFADRLVARKSVNKDANERAENTGILLASGFIAGESLTGVLLAVLVLVVKDFESLTSLLFGVSQFEFVEAWGGNLLGLLAFAAIAWVLIVIPLQKTKA